MPVAMFAPELPSITVKSILRPFNCGSSPMAFTVASLMTLSRISVPRFDGCGRCVRLPPGESPLVWPIPARTLRIAFPVTRLKDPVPVAANPDVTG